MTASKARSGSSVLAEPQFAPLRVDFTAATRRMLTVVLDGLTTATG